MICKNCGNQMEDNATFCTNCGAALTEPAAPVYEQPVTQPAPIAPKSKTTAVLLAWFLGTLGIHNFYLGNTTKGIIQLAISVVSCGTLAVVSAYWGIAEGIMILTGKISTDAQGNPLDL